jgi:hypothetical protein
MLPAKKVHIAPCENRTHAFPFQPEGGVSPILLVFARTVKTGHQPFRAGRVDLLCLCLQDIN